jgi:glycosyltransferase involved in cell wall biosynthesis
MTPLVSCLCPTFGRADSQLYLLEEAVESFRRQTYDNCELLILNDCPNQRLVCNVRGVRVVNLSYRIKTLGDKYNVMVELSRGDLLMPWEDDDISLPNRVAQAVEHIAGHGYWNPQETWYWDQAGLHHDHSHGVCHNASIFTRMAWQAAKYESTSGAQDAMIDSKLKHVARVAEPFPAKSPSHWQYIYRWGVSNYHLSGNMHAWEDYGKQEHRKGIFEIRPQWQKEYQEICKEYLLRLHLP